MTRPRFILPQFMVRRLQANFYKYEVNFEDAANESTGTYNSNTSFLIDVNDNETKKRLKKSKRKDRLMNEECLICLNEMKKKPDLPAVNNDEEEEQDDYF